jgi:energy-coupling factor transporter ATP-binding protein EcfA2
MIKISDLSVHYGDIPALQHISLQVADDECVLVTGPSGCGKSTLAQVICGLIPHAIPAQVEGQVIVDGLDPLTRPVGEIAQHVGMVFQRPASQLFHLRVEDEVSFGPRNLGLSESEVQERTEWALKATGMYELRNDRPIHLSGGQKQCLAIATALALRNDILVLDEPTASLDVPNTSRVMDTLIRLRHDLGISIILIEHRLAEATQLAERVILMEAGRIIAAGSWQEVFADRQLRLRLGLRRPREAPSIAWESLIQPNGSRANPCQPLLELQHICAGYNGQAVISDIQLNFYPGEFIALVGDNGAGKSTLAMVAAGLIRPQSGKVRYSDGSKPLPGQDVSLLFQDPQDQLFTDSVEEEVAFAPQNYGSYDPESSAQILREADLWELRRRHPLAISIGQQQRTALAACVSIHPRMVILDEPTLGQDWGHLQRLMNYLQRLQSQGTTVVLITHDYKLVHHYAQRVVLLSHGRIERIGKIGKEAKDETNHA